MWRSAERSWFLLVFTSDAMRPDSLGGIVSLEVFDHAPGQLHELRGLGGGDASERDRVRVLRTRDERVLECSAFSGEVDVRLSAIVGIGDAFDQSSTLHPLERPRHGRLFDGKLLDQ